MIKDSAIWRCKQVCLCTPKDEGSKVGPDEAANEKAARSDASRRDESGSNGMELGPIALSFGGDGDRDSGNGCAAVQATGPCRLCGRCRRPLSIFVCLCDVCVPVS